MLGWTTFAVLTKKSIKVLVLNDSVRLPKSNDCLNVNEESSFYSKMKYPMVTGMSVLPSANLLSTFTTTLYKDMLLSLVYANSPFQESSEYVE